MQPMKKPIPRWLATLAGLLLLAPLVGCLQGPNRTTASLPNCANVVPGDPEAGEELFRHTLRVTGGKAPTCMSCHEVDNNEQLSVGPGLRGIANVAGSRVPELSAEEYLCRAIVAPREHIVEGYPEDNILMPITYGATLTQQQINDLIAYMLTLDATANTSE
jgi:cytochrome c553